MTALEITDGGNSIVFLSGLIAAGLAVIHLLARNLLFLQVVPRSRWLSFGSGVSVAYVFIHILPELNEQQESIQETLSTQILFLENHVYLIALVGVSVFYGLERLAKESRQHNQATGEGDVTESHVFWIHIASFAVYNALIGYLLLHRETSGLISLITFAIAMGLHFIVNDYGLRQDHKKSYDRMGRWILAAAIVVGWVIGTGTAIHQAAIAVLFAFLAGGVILNVLKEELPEERKSRFWAFALGAIGYTILLLAI
jgi:zinc transporter ZupT